MYGAAACSAAASLISLLLCFVLCWLLDISFSLIFLIHFSYFLLRFSFCLHCPFPIVLPTLSVQEIIEMCMLLILGGFLVLGKYGPSSHLLNFLFPVTCFLCLKCLLLPNSPQRIMKTVFSMRKSVFFKWYLTGV